ncbi:Chitinase 2 [Tephrocybe sp. NHM501043]|nr:Chitinase 2 [Tephrocybe sp. NHM501043]
MFKDNWAKTTSPNKNVKIYVGAPSSASAAGSGYVAADALSKIASETRTKYSSFGGIMLWDASQAQGTLFHWFRGWTGSDNEGWE